MDLTQLLAGSNPYVALAGIAVTLIANYLRTGAILPKAPVLPVPTPVPVPTPSTPVTPDPAPVVPTLPGLTGHPWLNLALQLLPILAQRKTQQAAAPVTPFAAVAYNPYEPLETAVLKQLAQVSDPGK